MKTTTIVQNGNGHFVVEFSGLNLSGKQESARFEAAGFPVSKEAKACLASGEYDQKHCLVAGQVYRAIIIPGRGVVSNLCRTTEALREVHQKYGYGRQTPAGFIPRVCESISDEWMREVGLLYIVGLHEPLASRVICVGQGMCIGTYLGNPGAHWDNMGGFVFPA